MYEFVMITHVSLFSWSTKNVKYTVLYSSSPVAQYDRVNIRYSKVQYRVHGRYNTIQGTCKVQEVIAQYRVQGGYSTIQDTWRVQEVIAAI